jgi:hypothetical protein
LAITGSSVSMWQEKNAILLKLSFGGINYFPEAKQIVQHSETKFQTGNYRQQRCTTWFTRHSDPCFNQTSNCVRAHARIN